MTLSVLSAPRRSGAASPWLAAIVYGLPNPARPGLLAFCIVICRATLGGLLIALPATTFWGDATLRAGFPRLVVSLAWVVFEELARLNFAYRADRAVRALLLFLVLIVGVETLAYPAGGYELPIFLVGRTPSVAIHVIATAAVSLGLRERRWLQPAFVTVVAVHTAFNVWAPDLVGALIGFHRPTP